MTPRPDQTILVTGGSGFLGQAVCERFAQRGFENIVAPRSAEYDLTRADQVEQLYADHRPDVVVHLAATVGGIGANRENPGRYFYDNMAMGLHVVEGARRAGVQKFVQVGTICAYPKHTPVPFREEELWNGHPEETNAPYGVAKRALLTMLQAYRQQYELCGIYLLPVNLFGPRDNFDLHSSHVIPAMIRRFTTARDEDQKLVELWGTGHATREFLYVEDCANGIVLATERYRGAEPVNLGTGREVSIRDLAHLIRDLTGYQGDIRWNTEMPDGQPRRCLDTSKAEHLFGFVAETELEAGLRKTVEWWQARQHSSDASLIHSL